MSKELKLYAPWEEYKETPIAKVTAKMLACTHRYNNHELREEYRDKTCTNFNSLTPNLLICRRCGIIVATDKIEISGNVVHYAPLRLYYDSSRCTPGFRYAAREYSNALKYDVQACEDYLTPLYGFTSGISCTPEQFMIFQNTPHPAQSVEKGVSGERLKERREVIIARSLKFN